MATRYVRGFFRVWIVLSVLWVGGVGVKTWSEFEYWKRLVFVPDKPQPGAPILSFDDLIPVGNIDYLLFHAPEFISLSILPPALILAFGAASVWAFRGFRP